MKRLTAILCLRFLSAANAFVLQAPSSTARTVSQRRSLSDDRILLQSKYNSQLRSHSSKRNPDTTRTDSLWTKNRLITGLRILGASLTIAGSCWFATTAPAVAATDSKEILSCLLQKCPKPLTQCITNPKCLANVVCLNTCGDNIDCQIKCGDLFENETVGDFNKCVVSDMSCVKQKPDDGSYPIPEKDATVKKFDTSFFSGRLYITAGTLLTMVDKTHDT